MPTAQDLARRILTADAGASLPLLREAGFADAAAASQALDRLAGPAGTITPLPQDVLAAVLTSGWPDRALRHFERYVEVTGTRTSLYARLAEAPPAREALMRLLAHSRFLTDILVRSPELLPWLFEDTPHLAQPLERAALRRLLRQGLEGVAEHDIPDALRRFQRRELLRVGAAQILGSKGVDQVGRELADLADVCVEAALDSATRQLRGRYGRACSERGRPALFSVVGLGKYGGRELNFSSDIDLLFVYDEEGRTRDAEGAGGLDNAVFFDRLGKRLIEILTEVRPEGFVYRVDMRLRPEGEAGPLTRSLRSHWIYYETRGELWERQMLLKARKAAGSTRLWRRFRAMLTPFIHPSHFRAPPREAIRRVKERIEAEIRQRPDGGNNIKLQAGGIRDIEFIVQCLQLLSGRPSRAARDPGTLPSITRLQRAGALSADEARTLADAYRFLRRVENLLQADSGRPTYAVPAAGTPEAAVLAHGLQLGGTDPASAVADCCASVRAIYEDLFYGAAEPAWAGGEPGRNPAWLLAARSGAPGARRCLADMGFAAPEESHRVLLQLGSDPMLTAIGREHLEQLLAELLPQLAATPDADAGLVRFARIVEAYGAAGAFFGMALSHPRFLSMLVTICGASGLLSDLLQHDPSLLDRLVGLDTGGDLPPPDPAARRDPAALRRYRDACVLRIGVDDLLRLTSSEETFHRLSDLADRVLGVVLDRARGRLQRRRGRPRTRAGRDATFVCIAGGKAGGRELDFASDLDLFFVYEGEGQTGRGVDNGELFAELARQVLAGLRQVGYDVDARLRPEGRSAPVVISLAGYRRYLGTRAATWERLALSRARVVAGDARLGRRVLRAIEGFVFAAAPDAAFVDDVAEMRQRMEPVVQRGRAGADLKRGPGGIVDIEFIAQVLLLCHGRQATDLRHTSTRVLLERMVDARVLPAAQGRRLLRAYERLRQLQKTLRLAGARGGHQLPAPGPELEVLARAAGAEDGDTLTREVDALCTRTRADYEDLLSDVGAHVGRVDPRG